MEVADSLTLNENYITLHSQENVTSIGAKLKNKPMLN